MRYYKLKTVKFLFVKFVTLDAQRLSASHLMQQRLCLEAWHINSAHAPLNRDDGGLLPDAYLHLVRKKGR